jgi:hypothetical protein
VSPYMGYTEIALAHLESQTIAVQVAKGLCSVVDGRALNTAPQTSAHNVHRN